MPIRTRIIVLSADASGATQALGTAEVALVPKAATTKSVWPHADLQATHAASGNHYEPSDPASDPATGQWLLVVRAKSHSTVVQRLTFKESKGIVRAEAGWGATGPAATAATVSIMNYGETKAGPQPGGPEASLITVTLYPAQHFVSMASPKNDATYQLFAKGRFSYLFDRGRLNPGAVGVLINAPRKETEIVVKAQPRAVEAIVVVGVIPQADPAVPLSITDFYAALHNVGTNDPGSVVEAAVWSHAWHQGPIIFNKWDNFSHSVGRDPKDTDGRPKDWHASGVIAQTFPQLKDAFAKDGVFRIGGCSHMRNVTAEARAALAKKQSGTARTAFFEVTLERGWIQTTLDYTKRSIAQYVVASLFARFDEQGSASGHATYLGRAMQTLPIDVFGAPPGCEGNMGTIRASTGKALQTMKIVTVPFRNAKGKVIGGLENKAHYEYFTSEFGDAFEIDELNYMNYSKMKGIALPDPGWDTRRSIAFRASQTKTVTLRVASGLEVRGNIRLENFERGIAHSEGAKTGHLYVVKKCAPVQMLAAPYFDNVPLKVLEVDGVFEKKPAKDDLGLFVTTTGEVLLRVRTAGSSAFLPFNGVLPAFTAKQAPAGDIELIPGVPITGDLLEKAALKCHW